MNLPVKLLFDECIGAPLVEHLANLLSFDSPPPTLKHLKDFFSLGTPDAEWIPQIKSEGWIIFTADRGSKSSQMKLPSICVECKVTHILLGPSLLHAKQVEKAVAIISVWEQIKLCGNSPPGSRFQLTSSRGRATLKEIVLPAK